MRVCHFGKQQEVKMSVGIMTILPVDLRLEGGGSIEIPPWAFTPDAWNFAFLRGIRVISPSLRGLKVWEVGVGTGLNQMCLACWCEATKLYFSDYEPKCTELTIQNLEQIPDERFAPLFGQWDLVTRVDRVETAPRVDVIVACIPQVPTTLDLSLGDNLAHYYDPTRYEANLHAYGLGLNEALLNRAHGVLEPEGRVVLNLGGRPGLSMLEQMFLNCGYAPRVVHAEIIEQCPSTSLAGLAERESDGNEFEFFGDATGCERINAQLAEKRRLEGLKLFHKIYVIEGRRNT